MSGSLQAYRRSIRNACTAATIVALAALLAACPNPVTRLVDTDVLVASAGGRPVVERQSPEPGATEVAGDSPIVVDFSMAMDPASLTPQTIEVSSGGTPLSGLVAYNEDTRTVSFTPEADLPRDSVVEVVVSDQVRNAGGAPLSAPIEWSFTTKLVNDYEIAVTVEPSDDVVTEAAPMYVLAVDVSDRTSGFQTATDVTRFSSLTHSTTTYLDLRSADPAGDFWLLVHHDRDNSAGDGTDNLAYDPDALVGGFLSAGYQDRAQYLTDPDDRLGIHARGGVASTVGEMVMERVWTVDRYTRRSDAGSFANPDFVVRGGEPVMVRLYDEQVVAAGSADVVVLPVENNVPTTVPVSQYGTHWFRFTPSDSFVPSGVDIDRPAGGDVTAYVQAWLYEGAPNPANVNDEGTEFYSLNEAGTGFGFRASSAELNQTLTVGVEYYLRIVVVHLERNDGAFPDSAAVEITFSN